MMKSNYWFLSTCLGVALFLTGCGEPSTSILEEKIRPVRAVPATKTPTDIQRRFAGTISSASTSNISFRVSGIIADFPAAVGIPLQKGELITRLDNNDLMLKLEQDKAALRLAKVSAEKAESRYTKIKSLHNKQLISEIDYEAALAEFESGKAQVNQAQGSVELSQEQLSYAELRAPSESCTITEAAATKNENVASGQTVAVLSCGSEMEVISMVSEAVVSSIRIGQPVEVILNTKDSQPLKATISEVGMSSTTNGVYFVTARINDSHSTIRPGMAAELVIARQFTVVDDHLWVPMVAVGEEEHQKFVMIYVPNDEFKGVVKKVAVKTNRFAMGSLEITDGLEEGQLVITAGLSQIYNGLTVKLQAQPESR